jgi:hypothetical protein
MRDLEETQVAQIKVNIISNKINQIEQLTHLISCSTALEVLSEKQISTIKTKISDILETL